MSTMKPCAKCRKLIYAGVAHTCPDSACYYHVPLSDPAPSTSRIAQPAKAVDVTRELAIRVWSGYIESRDAAMLSGGSKDPLDHVQAALARAIGTAQEGCSRYRLLGPKDVVEPDDEFIDDNAVNWVRVGSTSGGHLFVGMSYRLGALKQARRKLPTPPADGEG